MSDLGLSETVSPHELLARYLTTKSLYSSENNRVKHPAFMPKDNNLEVSVFRIDGLNDITIWQIGEEVARSSLHSLKGRADIVALQVQNCGLYLNPDDNPPRHANIIGWPDEKSKRLEIAIELALKATLKLRI